MENTSKALLIAAAVLVAIIVITIGIKIFTSSSDTQKIATDTGKTIAEKTAQAAGIAVSEIQGRSAPGISGTQEMTPETYPEMQTSSTWSDNGDGCFTNSNTGTKVQIGDTVKYEEKLTANAVDGNKKASLISDLGTYSGNTDSNENTDAKIVRDNLTWKVLDVKDGKIRLISTVPTTSKIRLYGENGYNNAVYLIDKACDKLYSVDGVGKAQNLKIEDIEEKIDKTKFDYTQYANSNVDTGKYGGTKEYTSNLQYPNIYSSEIGCKAVATANNTGNTLGLSEQTSPITEKSTATNKLKTTQTYWYRSMASTDFTDSKYYTLFINNGSNLATYWLSSRCVHCASSRASFHVRFVYGGSGSVNSCIMFYSDGYTNGTTCAFRPVVSLESNIQLSGDSTNGWTIQ